MAVDNACFTKGNKIFRGCAPKNINASILILCPFKLSRKVLIPTEIPFIIFPIIIPAKGIVYCGLRIFSPIIPLTKISNKLKLVIIIDKAIIRLNFLFNVLFFDKT